MQGSLRVSGRPTLIKLRVSVDNVPADGEVDVADVMLQPGGSASGWMPHVTEMPWSAGVTPDEETSTVYSRLNALESEVSTIRTDIEPITVAGDIWRGESVFWDSRITAEWHPEHGWISWVDLAGLASDGASGDIEVTFAQTATVSTSSQPARWGVQILTQDASGVDSLTARLDIIDSTDTKTAEKGAASLDVWPTWSYDVRHDVTLPADTTAEPRVVLAGLGAGATGRVGLALPWVGTSAGAVDGERSTGELDITDNLTPESVGTGGGISLERRGRIVIFSIAAVDFGTAYRYINNAVPEGFHPTGFVYEAMSVDQGAGVRQIDAMASGTIRVREASTGGFVRGVMTWFTDDPWPGDPL